MIVEEIIKSFGENLFRDASFIEEEFMKIGLVRREDDFKGLQFIDLMNTGKVISLCCGSNIMVLGGKHTELEVCANCMEEV